MTYGYCLENAVHLKIIILRLFKYHWLKWTVLIKAVFRRCIAGHKDLKKNCFSGAVYIFCTISQTLLLPSILFWYWWIHLHKLLAIEWRDRVWERKEGMCLRKFLWDLWGRLPGGSWKLGRFKLVTGNWESRTIPKTHSEMWRERKRNVWVQIQRCSWACSSREFSSPQQLKACRKFKEKQKWKFYYYFLVIAKTGEGISPTTD